MPTSVDTNILVAFLKINDPLTAKAEKLLKKASTDGELIVCGAVYSELLGMPGRTEAYLDTFTTEMNIEVDWLIDEKIWRSAGRAFAKYASRRRKARSEHPRRILTDFLIGAHAAERGYSLLTLDDGIFRAAFPKLRLLKI
ncbi:MAG: PIN domain-containing protein [Acidobacteria bacterium]|nr:PIN domain-containing protein [Acidobacteriota bacterium]